MWMLLRHVLLPYFISSIWKDETLPWWSLSSCCSLPFFARLSLLGVSPGMASGYPSHLPDQLIACSSSSSQPVLYKRPAQLSRIVQFPMALETCLRCDLWLTLISLCSDHCPAMSSSGLFLRVPSFGGFVATSSASFWIPSLLDSAALLWFNKLFKLSPPRSIHRCGFNSKGVLQNSWISF